MKWDTSLGASGIYTVGQYQKPTQTCWTKVHLVKTGYKEIGFTD